MSSVENTMLAVFIVLLSLGIFFIVFLILRNVVLWYWKIIERTEIQKQILEELIKLNKNHNNNAEYQSKEKKIKPSEIIYQIINERKDENSYYILLFHNYWIIYDNNGEKIQTLNLKEEAIRIATIHAEKANISKIILINEDKTVINRISL